MTEEKKCLIPTPYLQGRNHKNSPSQCAKALSTPLLRSSCFLLLLLLLLLLLITLFWLCLLAFLLLL